MAVPAAAAVLYSFRRCPFAIRARLALAAAGWLPGRDLELREVALAAKPPELLEASPHGTVPVLVAPDGGVLGESLAIMQWALESADPHGWLVGWDSAAQQAMQALIAENDGPFKHHLDRSRYASRYSAAEAEDPETHRAAALAILQAWSRRLQQGGWLLGERPSLADPALLPFVRQFRLADPARFAAETSLEPLRDWLDRFLRGQELAAVMASPWGERRAWRSPQRLYHLALRGEWREAQRAGAYRRSSRGQSLESLGFVHLSYAHQLPATYGRFYADLPAGEVLLLSIDPERLAQAGLTVRPEAAPESGELFPHLYGPLPLAAVVLVERW
jgi:glutathione S-transferase